MRRLVFVGGTHGVGKSTICRQLADFAAAVHLSSGELIRRAETARAQRLSDKRVADVQKNQDVLIAALEAQSAARVLLDGHFVLLRPGGKLTEVPITTLAAIAPAGVLLLVDAPGAIASRLSTRDGVRYEEAGLADLQDREQAAAVNVTRTLNVPLYCATPTDNPEALGLLVRGWLDQVM